jgi:hypothetical protein
MNKAIILANLYRAATNMFTQFSTEEPLINEDVKAILNSSKGRQELCNKIIDKPQRGVVVLTFEGKTFNFFVEA